MTTRERVMMTNEQTTTAATARPIDAALATIDELLQQHDEDSSEPTMLSDARDRLAEIAAQNVLVLDDADLHLLWLATETLVESNPGDDDCTRLDRLVGEAVQQAQQRREAQRPHARRQDLPEGATSGDRHVSESKSDDHGPGCDGPLNCTCR